MDVLSENGLVSHIGLDLSAPDGKKTINADAPSATVILADFGVEVIKVEPPTGDPWRYRHMTPGLITPRSTVLD